MKVIEGDLLTLAMDGEFDVIVHGCNCFCSMNGGIAESIRYKFPEAQKVDNETRDGDIDKLGNYSEVSIIRNDISFTIINAYTQFDYRGEQKHVDYLAIEKVFSKIKSNYSSLRIGYPQIGAGLAGGDWNIISGIIEKVLCGENHTLVKFDPLHPQGKNT